MDSWWKPYILIKQLQSNLSVADILYSGHLAIADRLSNSHSKPSKYQTLLYGTITIADTIFRNPVIICLETYLSIVDTLIFGQIMKKWYCMILVDKQILQVISCIFSL